MVVYTESWAMRNDGLHRAAINRMPHPSRGCSHWQAKGDRTQTSLARCVQFAVAIRYVRVDGVEVLWRAFGYLGHRSAARRSKHAEWQLYQFAIAFCRRRWRAADEITRRCKLLALHTHINWT